jgi:hypothetical protein
MRYRELTIWLSAEEYAQLEALAHEDAEAVRQLTPHEETSITPESTAAAIIGQALREHARKRRERGIV